MHDNHLTSSSMSVTAVHAAMSRIAMSRFALNAYLKSGAFGNGVVKGLTACTDDSERCLLACEGNTGR
jgi:hypothetical protein